MSSIDTEHVGVSLFGFSDGSLVSCAVFHDASDGSSFGRLMCYELWSSFHTMYHHDLQDAKVNSPDLFTEFNGKIAQVIRNTTKPIMDALSEVRGITLVLLNTTDSVTHIVPSATTGGGGEVDKLAVLAHHQALMGAAQDIMSANNDTPKTLTLKGKKSTTKAIRIERSTLVVVYKNNVDAEICNKEIDKAEDLIRKVLVMASNLKT